MPRLAASPLRVCVPSVAAGLNHPVRLVRDICAAAECGNGMSCNGVALIPVHSAYLGLCAGGGKTVGKNYVDIEKESGETLRYRKHVNGRGLIAHGAKVHPTAVVETGAYVEPGAQIAAGVHVHHGAWIESDAVIGPEAEIAAHAHIGPGAAVGARSKIGVRTSVGDHAIIAMGSLIGDDEIIADRERVATDKRGLRLAA